jgi:hypothetical protein
VTSRDGLFRTLIRSRASLPGDEDTLQPTDTQPHQYTDVDTRDLAVSRLSGSSVDHRWCGETFIDVNPAFTRLFG